MTTTATATVYAQLIAKIDHVVKNWRSDLDVDKEVLIENDGLPFIHVARENGTHLVLLHPADHEVFPPAGEKTAYLFGTAGRRTILHGKTETVECLVSGRSFSDKIIVYHYYDGKKLYLVTASEALYIVKEYESKIMRQWLSN